MPSEHLQIENLTIPPFFFPASERNPFLNLQFVYICKHREGVCIYTLIHPLLHDEGKLLQFVMQIKTRLSTFPKLLNQNWRAAILTGTDISIRDSNLSADLFDPEAPSDP